MARSKAAGAPPPGFPFPLLCFSPALSILRLSPLPTAAHTAARVIHSGSKSARVTPFMIFSGQLSLTAAEGRGPTLARPGEGKVQALQGVPCHFSGRETGKHLFAAPRVALETPGGVGRKVPAGVTPPQTPARLAGRRMLRCCSRGWTSCISTWPPSSLGWTLSPCAPSALLTGKGASLLLGEVGSLGSSV